MFRLVWYSMASDFLSLSLPLFRECVLIRRAIEIVGERESGHKKSFIIFVKAQNGLNVCVRAGACAYVCMYKHRFK